MKHYHGKTELSDSDVQYIVVQTGEVYELEFGDVDMYDLDRPDLGPFFQGIKLWLNRVEIQIGENEVSDLIPIFWFDRTTNTHRESDRHIHFYGTKFKFRISTSERDKPNIGILNVWSSDKRRCYELTENSWIKKRNTIFRIRKNQRNYCARYGWSAGRKPTMRFKLKRISQ